MENLKERFMQKLFQKENLIVLILSGVLLLVIALPVNKKEDDVKKSMDVTTSTEKTEKTQQGATGAEAVSRSASYEAYEEALELRLCRLLEGMKGVGEVRVMITLASSDEQVVEKDRPVKRTNTTESDSAGGSRTIYDVETGEATVYTSEGSLSEPYVIKTLMPRVEGVAVVAEGAGTGEISKNITEAVQALFDLEAHKIKVIPGK